MMRRGSVVALGLATAAAVGSFARVEWVRRVAVDMLLGRVDAGPYGILSLMGAFANELRAMAVLGVSLSVLALLTFGVGRSSASCRGALERISLAAAAMIVAATGCTLLAMAFAMRGTRSACADPIVAERIEYESWAAYLGPFHAAGIAIVAVGVLATLLIVARLRSSDAETEERSLRLPVVVFTVGLAAFLATRAEAYDAAHAIPLLAEAASDRSFLAEGEVPTLEGGTRACDGSDGPTVALGNDGWSVDGVAVRDTSEMVKVLAAKRELYALTHDGKPPPRFVVGVAVRRETRLSTLATTFAGLRDAGYGHVEVLMHLPAKVWSSRSLGDVPYVRRHCAVEIENELPMVGSWGDLVRARVAVRPEPAP